MRVSIVTVCRNGAATLSRCLDGVAAQGAAGVEIEHVVQDGASTDGTAALLEAHGRRVALRAVSEADGGQNDAFVRALGRVTGDVVGFSWADEQLLPGAVERAVVAFGEDPELVAVYGDVLDTAVDGAPIGVRTSREWAFEAIGDYAYVPPVCAAFVRREVVDTFLRMVAHGPEVTEWLLWLAAGVTGRVQRVPAVLSAYASHAGQLSRRPDIVEGYPDLVLAAARAVIDVPGIPDGLRQRPEMAGAHAHLQAGEWLGTLGDEAAVLRHLDAAVALAPDARLLPVHVWAQSVRWLVEGRTASLRALLVRARAADVTVPGVPLLQAAARDIDGDDDRALAGIRRLRREPEPARLAVPVANVLRALEQGGRPETAERLLARLARLAHGAPAWRPVIAMILTNLQRFEEALEVAQALDDGVVADGLRVQLELLVALRSPDVRRILGVLSGRRGGLTLDEAAGLALAVGRMLAGRADPSGALVETLLVVEQHARVHGLARLAAAIAQRTAGAPSAAAPGASA